jgi:hypothetical protein
MTNTPLVTGVDHHVDDAAQALDLASTALIRAQELAGQDTTGAAPARLAQATAMLRGNLRMLADMLTFPQPPATEDAPSQPSPVPADRGRRGSHVPGSPQRPPRIPVPEAHDGRA